MRFDLTDEQQAIRETVDRIFAERLTPERTEELVREESADLELWDELCELGFAGLAVAEEHGGQGLGLLELGLVCESAGAALAPVPLRANAAAGLVQEAAAGHATRERLLPGIADGSAPGSVALIRDGRDRLSIDPERPGPLLVVERERAAVAEGGEAPPARPTIDLMRRYREVSTGAPASPLPGDAAPAIDRAEILLAAELTGVAQRALDLAVAYAGERHQFGRPIGSFQGVSHRCAQIMLEVESARSIWRYASWVDGAEPEWLGLAASSAKVAAASAAVSATTGAIQVLGGIGFTWEHDIHRYLRRAKVACHTFGDVTSHRRRIASHLRRADDAALAAAGS